MSAFVRKVVFPQPPTVPTISEILDAVYPVGTILEFYNFADPNALYDGTEWQELTDGRVTVSHGGDFETLGAVGGQKSVKMTSGMLIEHLHEIEGQWLYGNGEHSFAGLGTGSLGVDGGNPKNKTDKTGSADPEPIPTMPPYVVVKRWKRIA